MADPLDTVPHQVTDDAGKVTWVFPASWAAADCIAFEALASDVAVEEARIETIVEEDEAATVAPTAILAAKRAELAEKKAARIALERDRAEDVIYADAVKEYGGEHRVARIRTREGSIILRAMTGAESDRVGARIHADGIKDSEALAIARDALRATVLHPPRPAFDKLVTDYASLWVELYQERDRLTSGREDAAAKKA